MHCKWVKIIKIKILLLLHQRDRHSHHHRHHHQRLRRCRRRRPHWNSINLWPLCTGFYSTIGQSPEIWLTAYNSAFVILTKCLQPTMFSNSACPTRRISRHNSRFICQSLNTRPHAIHFPVSKKKMMKEAYLIAYYSLFSKMVDFLLTTFFFFLYVSSFLLLSAEKKIIN